MKTQDQAAALIQARWRGKALRRVWARFEHTVTTLQAHQRGRYVRKHFAEYRRFRAEQVAFEDESKKRRARIWHHQQQLLYMETITPEQYERLMGLRRARAAMLIQARWREYRVYVAARRPTWSSDDEDEIENDAGDWQQMTGGSSHSTISNGPAFVPTESSAVDPHAFLETKSALQKKLHRQVAATAHEWRRVPPEDATKSDKLRLRKQTYAHLQHVTAKTGARLRHHKTEFRAQRADAELERQALLERCERRLHRLLQPPPLPSVGLAYLAAIRQLRPEIAKFPLPKVKRRRQEALKAHHDVMQSLKAARAWNMPVAGTLHDMRRHPATWPWTAGDSVWCWPKEYDADVAAPPQAPVDADDPLCVFLDADPAVTDLPWLEFSQRVHSDVVPSPCSTLHPRLLSYARRPPVVDVYGDGFESAVGAQSKQIVAQVNAQIQFNTQLRLKAEDENRRRPPPPKPVPAVDYGLLRRHNMATRIQARYRGHWGRRRANEIRAEHFVMVRGRAVRKGLCEECAEHRAVLECRECEESTHFCPQCWVLAHATRRRKGHAPIPMTSPPAPATTEAPPMAKMALHVGPPRATLKQA
ncbi:hypothetical protein ACHHYP_06995 [Achlya hypogyna]|uniref:Uncharacterized protein n=1 Tax=Achlya hypogyna TaxID=1202772 RepID=A0A1V9YRG4_ACHHY|nr:hypothetical protein ACHHYP_06995 [Achlya hypogyna]